MILTRDGKEITAVYRQDGSEVDEVKDAAGRLIYTASREITGTLPLSFSGRGKPLTNYLISGNTVQDGTPTPDNPVDVVGCGVMTENLCSNVAYKPNYYINEQGIEIADNRFNIYSVFCNSNATYTISLKSPLSGTTFRIHAYNNGVWISQTVAVPIQNMPFTFTTPNNADEIRVSIANGANGNIMLNLGSTPLPYEPYGFKLPITCGGTEYPIYLGQVETTRRIKKLVLTGAESWMLYNGNYYSNVTDRYSLQNMPCRCTHTAGGIIIDNGMVRLKVFASRFTTVASNLEEWKSYLAAQYAAGTPVTVWYVLAEPETAIVNEPLMKIGIYADTITMAQAGVTIPTIRGTNVLDMTTPVNPSEVYIKGKGIKSIT